MNEGVLLIDGGGVIISAQVWADGISNAINDEIMESDGVTLQRIFWGDYAGPGAGPAIPMVPIPPVDILYIPVGNLFEAIDVRLFEAIDNRMFEA